MAGGLLKELFDWIEGQVPALQAGVNWHCGSLPPEGEGPMAALLGPLGPADAPRTSGRTGEGRFQVITVGGQGAGMFATLAFAEAIHALLQDRPGLALPSYTIHTVQALQEPYRVANESRLRWEFSANYLACYSTTAAWARG